MYFYLFFCCVHSFNLEISCAFSLCVKIVLTTALYSRAWQWQERHFFVSCFEKNLLKCKKMRSVSVFCGFKRKGVWGFISNSDCYIFFGAFPATQRGVSSQIHVWWLSIQQNLRWKTFSFLVQERFFCCGMKTLFRLQILCTWEN